MRSSRTKRFGLDNWQDLVDDLLQLARTSEVSGEIGRPDRRPAVVVPVWIVERDSLPRLVTAYPG